MNPTTNYSAVEPEENSFGGVIGHSSAATLSPETGTALESFPDFRSLRNLQSRDARAIGRSNAAKISDEEYDRWQNERGALITKEFSEGGLSKKEKNHLTYVEWNLARIEDARYGATLDALDAAVSRYEEFAVRIESLQEQLKDVTTQYSKEVANNSRRRYARSAK